MPLLTYRTGPFAGSGIPIANGMHDYLDMLNERDGGIGGVKIAIEECETGYDTKKGVECYEPVKSKKPVVINPYSTGITLRSSRRRRSTRSRSCRWPMASRPRRSARNFPWIFNPPATYWDGLSMIIKYIGEQGRRARQAQGQDHRLHLLRRRLRPRADPAARAVRQGLRLRGEAVSGAAGRDAEPVRPLAQRAPRPSGLDDHVGLGRDEPDRREGSRQDQLPDGQVHRRLVVGQRG